MREIGADQQGVLDVARGEVAFEVVVDGGDAVACERAVGDSA
jgi:hypothetical protein